MKTVTITSIGDAALRDLLGGLDTDGTADRDGAHTRQADTR